MNPELFQRMAEVERVHWWYRVRNAIICEFVQRLGIPAGARILDVGCGTGALTEKLAEQFTVFASDPSEFAVSHLRKRGAVQAFTPGELELQTSLYGSFDVLGFFDVLEHAENDQALLERYLTFLKPAGIVVAAVPAWEIFWGAHDVAAEHYRRYHLARLRQAFEAVHFRPIASTYYNLLLAPAVLFVRGMSKFRRTPPPIGDLQLPGPIANALLRVVFSMELHLLRHARLPFGVSLVAAFQR